MIFLDTFVTDMCDAFNYPEIMVDLICNICYYGPNDYDVTGPLHLDFENLEGNFLKVIPSFFCNSLEGIYEIFLNLISFLLSFSKIDRKFVKRSLAIDDVDKMVQLFDDYQKLFGKDFHLNLPEKDQCLQMLFMIERDIRERMDGCAGDFSKTQSSFEICEGMLKKDGFFERLLLTVRELMDDETWKDSRIVVDTVREFTNNVSTLPFLILSLKKREVSPQRLIGANTSEFKDLRLVYVRERDNLSQMAKFNKVLVFSGNMCSILWEYIRKENYRHMEPEGMTNDIWDEFSSAIEREDLIHSVERGDFILSAPAFKYLMSIGDLEPLQKEELGVRVLIPKDQDFGGSYFQDRPSAFTTTIMKEESTWTVQPIIVIILIGILAYILFV
jgi:hypothetical protein